MTTHRTFRRSLSCLLLAHALLLASCSDGADGEAADTGPSATDTLASPGDTAVEDASATVDTVAETRMDASGPGEVCSGTAVYISNQSEGHAVLCADSALTTCIPLRRADLGSNPCGDVTAGAWIISWSVEGEEAFLFVTGTIEEHSHGTPTTGPSGEVTGLDDLPFDTEVTMTMAISFGEMRRARIRFTMTATQVEVHAVERL